MLSDRSSIYSRSSLGSSATNSRTLPKNNSTLSSSSLSSTRLTSINSSHHHYPHHYKTVLSSTSYHQQPYLTQSMLMAHCIASSGTPTITGYDLASSNALPNSYRRNYNPSHSSSKALSNHRYATSSSASSNRLDIGQHHHASNALRFTSSSGNSSSTLTPYNSTVTLPPRGLLSSTKPIYKPKIRERPLLSSLIISTNRTPTDTTTTAPEISSNNRRVLPDNYRLSNYNNMTKKSITDNSRSTNSSYNKDDQWSSDLTRNISRNKYIIKFREQEIKQPIEVRKASLSWDLNQVSDQLAANKILSNEATPKLTEEDDENNDEIKKQENSKPSIVGEKEKNINLNSKGEQPKQDSSDIILNLHASDMTATIKAMDADTPLDVPVGVPKRQKKNVRNLKIKVKNNQQQQTTNVETQDDLKLKNALSVIHDNKLTTNKEDKTKELLKSAELRLVTKDHVQDPVAVVKVKSSKKPIKKSTLSNDNEKPSKPSKTKVRSPKAHPEVLNNNVEIGEDRDNPLSKQMQDHRKQSDITNIENDTKRIRFREYNFEDFDFISVLGHGGWGFVFLAELRNHNVYFAVKCIKKLTILEDDDIESIMIERKVLTLGNIHPFICKLFCTFENEGYLFFVMEYCAGGDLMFHVQKEGKFSESRCRFYAAEIICAIRFLHNRHIIYRDLKLDNILLDASGHIRLVDFGMCQCRTYREELLPSNFCGTPEYISPEIIKGVPYNHSVDWWSFGVLLYEMAVGKMPFRGSDENELLWNVCYEQIHYPHFLSPELKSLLQLLLERDPVKRLGMATCTAGDIYEQPWFEGIDWKKIEELKVEPPFVPEVKSPKDVQNFDSDFTEATPQLSPIEESSIEKIDQQLFQGFSYTNPNLFFC